ncbi:hypothetical protein CHS0354_001871 [Potamilus streckersoni]|uniref:Uncharacterized protein n=1 Tax=Potamilus streckersoni TaxID=2493646 RepID=A0AAE0WC76_9BIVA|nr:hypothetical protein CHS0354_001871 [Potamilus streckersoni]
MKVLLLLGLLALVETRRIHIDSLQQNVIERELGEEGSQLQALVIRNFLRNLENRLGNDEINFADNPEDHRSENYAKGHHGNDKSSGVPSDIELLSSLAQQANEGASGKQEGLEEYTERRLGVAVGKLVSNPPKTHGSHGIYDYTG